MIFEHESGYVALAIYGIFSKHIYAIILTVNGKLFEWFMDMSQE